MIHDLKTWPEPFAAVARGDKKHEIRRDDRDFKVGDYLHLREYDPETGAYTGRHLWRKIAYKTEGGTWSIPEGICVLSIEVERPDSIKHLAEIQADAAVAIAPADVK